MAKVKLKRNVDPDKLLQRLVDLTAAEVRRLEAVRRHRTEPCQSCGVTGDIGGEARRFMLEATRQLTAIAFGARKLVTAKLLRQLSEGQLRQLEDELGDEQAQEGAWLPGE
jgi:hypothetical protein